MAAKSAQRLAVFHVLGGAYYLGQARSFLAWLLKPNNASRTVHVANVHTVVLGLWDKELAAAQRGATMKLADGRPLSLAAKILGCWQGEQLRGPDLMLSAAEAGAAKGMRHFYLGGAPGVAKAVARQLQGRVPGLKVVGSASPPYHALSERELRALAARLRRTRTQICWVGLGAPKQEKLMARLAVLKVPCTFVGVGAAFDYYAGSKAEAPRWMQALALEWLFRLAQEPGRLWWRYLSTNVPFVGLFALEYAGLYPAARQAFWVRAMRLASVLGALSLQQRPLLAVFALVLPLGIGRIAWLSGAQQ